MASTSHPTAQAVEPVFAEFNDEQSRLIDERLRQTRRYVKLIDLCTGAVILVGGILGYLLVVALIDHWLIDLTPVMRLILLLGLIAGAAGLFVRRLLPPLIYAVNPVFAAQAIEQAAPGLKNSLINLVLLARQRHGVAPVIYEGLRREAAGQLAHVPPETMVDRGPLVRAGFWLVGLLAAAAAYVVLSPKDPVQSIARLAAPWSDIDRPSRVKVLDVQPGDGSVYRGQTIDVTARIEGLKEGEPVTILYSSEDQQFIDQPISMHSDGAQRFRATLSTGPRGIQQTLRYRIAAGDTQSKEFVLQVKHAPHIEVRRTVYQFPRYTQLPDRVIEGQGELSALEGTRVQIEAEANQPVASAQLELFAESSAADSPDAQPTRAVPMKVEGNQAVGQLTLLLQTDRRSPQIAAYQIRITTPDGARNVHPSRYRIDVTPDLVPDVEWLQPRTADIELPENGSTTLEVRAFDPDFAVEQIRILGAVGGANRLSEDLLEQPQSGQVVRKYQLVPQQLGLQAGDTLIYWAEARDNRQSPAGTPAPNIQRTANRRIRIVAPVARQPHESGEGGEPGAADRHAADDTGNESDSQQGGEGQEAQQGQEGASGEGEAGGQGKAGNQRGEGQGKSDAGETGEGTEGTEASGDRAESGAEGSPAGNESTNEGGAADGQGGSRDGRGQARPDSPPEGENGEGANDDGGGSAADRGTDATGASAERQADGARQEDAGAGRGERRPADGDAGGDARRSTSGAEGTDDERESAAADEPAAEDESQPVPPDGSNDSEAFERILKHLRERRNAADPAGQRRDGARSQSQSPEGSPPDPTNDDAASGSSSSDSPDADSPPENSDPTRSGSGQRGERNAANDSNRTSDAAEPSSDAGRSPAGDRSATEGQRPTGNERPDPASGQPSGREASGANNAGSDNAGSDQAGSEQAGSDQSGSDQANSDRAGDSEASGDGRSGAESPAGRERDSGAASDSPRDGRRGARSDQSPTGANGQSSPNGDSSDSSPSAASDSSHDASSQGSGAPPASSGRPASDGSGEATRTPGGGQAGATPADGSTGDGESSGDDEANLEYARRATDLALQHLKDERHSAELQERLGWSREEVEAFLRRWEQMQREARQSGPQGEQARRRLSDQLRGLGLQPQAERVRGSRTRKDDLRSLRQSSNVPIPAEYLEQYRAFLKSAPSQEPAGAAPQPTRRAPSSNQK